MLSKFLIAVLVAIILWSGVFSRIASSQQANYQINNLESQYYRIENQINQLQLQNSLNNFHRAPLSTVTPPTLIDSPRRLSVSERDKKLDRLANLVVELKQQVNQLTTRVAKLESRATTQ